MTQSRTEVKPVRHARSSLEKFTLTFEYDRSWGDARKALRQKTNHS